MMNRAALDELMHEIRNELAVVQANVEAFIDRKLDPTPQRLSGMLEAIVQLTSLLDEVQALGKSDQLATQSSLINVCALLEREYASIEGIARAKDITLTVNRCPVTAEECKQFYGDPTRIGQIVKNLLLNAVRYTPRGAMIAIDCARRADQLQVTITDSGPGIDTGEVRKIFEDGFRGSASAQTSGSGHGLALVKRFVEAQGGEVFVADALPHGAAFTVRLPGKLEHAGDACSACGLQTPPAQIKAAKS